MSRPETRLGSGVDAEVGASVGRAGGVPRPAEPARHLRHVHAGNAYVAILLQVAK